MLSEYRQRRCRGHVWWKTLLEAGAGNRKSPFTRLPRVERLNGRQRYCKLVGGEVHRSHWRDDTGEIWRQVRCYTAGIHRRCSTGADRRFVFTHQVAELCCMKWRNGHDLESVTSNRKSHSVNRRGFTGGTILPNFIPIRLQTTESYDFLTRLPKEEQEQYE